MPYIKPAARDHLNEYPPSTPGDLNYLITKLIKQYLDSEPISYQRINDVLGALEGAKLEFYRRIVVKYEDKKRKENGDVY